MTEGYSRIFNINVAKNPNPLDEMTNVSYQWRLFMVNDLLLIKNRFDLDTTQQITLVETGKTSLYFGNVTIESTYAPTKDTLAAVRSTFKFDIHEPKGSNFYDLIYSSAVSLGIQNWAKSPFYLELKFRGYDKDGNITGLESALHWTWRIVIQQFSTEVTSGGSVHSITGMLTQNLSISAEYGTLKKPFSVKGNTFLEMMSDLEYQWNDYEIKTSATSSTALTQYKFLFYEDYTPNPLKLNWRDLRMITSFDSDQPSTQRTEGNQTGSFANGWRIQRILDTLIASSSFSEELKKFIPASDLEKNPDEAIKSLIGVAKSYRIESQVLFTAYDPISNDYEKLIIYHIWPYDGITPILNATIAIGGTLDDAKTLEKQRKAQEDADRKIQYYEKSRIIGKVYNYIFTGKNIDVLSFDIKFNSLWKAFIAEYGRDSSIKGPNPDNAALLNQDTVGFSNKPIDEQRQIIQQTLQYLKDARKAVDDNKRVIEQANQNTTLTTEVRAAEIEAANTNISQQQKIIETTEGKLISFRQAFSTAASETIINQQANRTLARYAEDLPNDPQRILPAPVPITVKSTDALGTGKEGQAISEHFFEGRNFMAAVLNQMYSTRLSDWMNIELEIRGDPYWFGFSGMAKGREYFSIVEASGASLSPGGRSVLGQTDPAAMVVPVTSMPTELKMHLSKEIEDNLGLPVFETSEQCFLINFYTPSVFAEEKETFTGRKNDLGYAVPKKNAFISGIYAIHTISHNFIDGKFTQQISAKRDPHTAQYSLQEIYNNKPLLDAIDRSVAAAQRSDKTKAEIISRVKKDGISKTPVYTNSSNISEIVKQKPSTITTSDAGIAALIESEGFKNTSYQDANARSIGVGHKLTKEEMETGFININNQPVNWRDGLSNQQVTALFYQDLAEFDQTIQDLVKTPLTQEQHDALVNFTYNVGKSGFKNSTLLKELNKGNYDVVTKEMARWRYSINPSTGQKEVNQTLAKRREKEIKIWNG